jgi:hypothetical protein
MSGQYSPDGRWWWDGKQWVPVQQPPPLPPPQPAPRPPAVDIVTYKTPKDYEKDAKKRIAGGWQMQGQSSLNSQVAVGRTVGKAVLTGGVGLLLSGRSKKGGGITVTWIKP